MSSTDSAHRGRLTPSKIDPTRTATLRRAFAAKLSRRFGAVLKATYRLLTAEDALGMLTANVRWKHLDPAAKVKAFQDWLKTQVRSEVNGRGGDDYWRSYIEEGFRKGMARAFDDTRPTQRSAAASSPKVADYYRGTRDEFLRSSFGRPAALGTLKLLIDNSLNNLTGVTDDMALRMTRALADGLVRGDGPRKIAAEMARQLGISKGRALVVARTELVRAHAEGQLTALEELGVGKVGVAVEWSVAGDDKVCPLCQPLQGIVLTVKEARGMLPRHPNCRCAWVPANVGENVAVSSPLRKDTKPEIKKAFRQSAAEESGDGSNWPGGSKAVAAKRPEPVIGNAHGAASVDPLTTLGRWLRSLLGERIEP